MKKAIIKSTARILLLTLSFQLVWPAYSYALTTGPSQPEVQSFEPVGTTELVDPFTGDFNYNIPLMDVEGYPINISYHSGINIEQEASWVGLGWNINPGEINRAMRGLPDDFNGETIEKSIHIQPEKNFKVDLGIDVGVELFGFDPKKYGVDLSLSLGAYANFNNYKGVSIGTKTGATLSTPIASAGISMGIGTQSGGDIDMNAGAHLPKAITGDMLSISPSAGIGFNSRSGLKDLTYNVGIMTAAGVGANYGGSIPMSLQNYVPVITNGTILKAFAFQLRVGGELFYTYPNVHLKLMQSTLEYEANGSKKGYGYLYAENGDKGAIMDFSRDKDGVYNNTLRNLPLASMTYDIYSACGQGTGGSFRLVRNDVGTVYDPEVVSETKNNDLLVEVGIGTGFELGSDINVYENKSVSGPWAYIPFSKNKPNDLFEKAFFKQAGELTYNNMQSAGSALYNDAIQLVNNGSSSLEGGAGGLLPTTFSNNDRTSRANLLTYQTAAERENNIFNYADFTSLPGTVPAYGGSAAEAKKDHISEMTQTLPDGRRYVYGIPALNHTTDEMTFNVKAANANIRNGLVSYRSNDATVNNLNGRERFFSKTTTPAYAYSYLLSSVLSSDYVDIMGDGPTNDDIGDWTKINYGLFNDDYKWRAPYGDYVDENDDKDTAQYVPGFWSDKEDDKGNVIKGSKQIWHIRSIESKNYVAEFYTTPRIDGKGASATSLSYKLDSIKLFNKHDRFINTTKAIPIKTVMFKYNYSLCKNVPNVTGSQSTSQGKLTLEKIFIRYGNSDKNLLSPYSFTYHSVNPNYDFAAKDRWGNYKKNDDSLSNYEFPYANQAGIGLDDTAAAWNLTGIQLPSGGEIKIDYESDDYSFVQDRRTMQMVRILGVGKQPDPDYMDGPQLYDNLDNNSVNDYIYFKRSANENPSLSFAENYLEDPENLYYSFNLDITNTGRFENIKGYAKVIRIDKCPNDNNYGYIQLEKVNGKRNGYMAMHPATLYGLNIARYYLPHIIYPGFKGGDDDDKNLLARLKDAAGELKPVGKNPFEGFLNDKKGKNINPEKCWVRLNVPMLTKKGGGVRVKQLTIKDKWQSLGSGTDATYGKKYSYTISDGKYGDISSGVASYEPMVGGDENPFKKPVAYTAAADKLLPSIDFFQEEPFGEPFFPPPVVGYSRVTVTSIHKDEGKSSQSEEQYEFFTAKDFPIEVVFNNKVAPNPVRTKNLRRNYEEVQARQGYVMKFNDMHGKPKSLANYNIKKDGSTSTPELVSKIAYKYRRDNKGKLSNRVRALVRQRGSTNTYSIQDDVSLGEEIDFTIDSRERDSRSYNRSVALNLNTVVFGVFPIPIPTAFFPDKEERQIFHSLVSTKVVQKYGILDTIETFDHGAKIVSLNRIYDAETGAAILTSTNNQYGEQEYDLKYPAYFAYEGMGPAYTNAGYEENNATLSIVDSMTTLVPGNLQQPAFPTYLARLYCSKEDAFSNGDEILLKYKKNDVNCQVKVWIVGTSGGELRLDASGANLGEFSRVVAGRPYYIVAPRILFKSNVLQWPQLSLSDSATGVSLKILRSGRRNNLDQYVQQVRIADNPYMQNLTASQMFGGGNSIFSKVLNVNVQQFTDNASPYLSALGNDFLPFYTIHGTLDYSPYSNEIINMFPAVIGNDSLFNKYVLGHKGNFRPSASYVYQWDRSYTLSYADGGFDMSYDRFWNTTGTGRTVLRKSVTVPNWKITSMVGKYDVFGNAVEETDGTGKVSAAQYGYNKNLPVAVGSNVLQRGFCFDGFEDYSMLVPAYMHLLYKSTKYYQSPFASKFNAINVGPLVYKQTYYYYNPVNNGDSITNSNSHTGFYSFRPSAERTFDIETLNQLRDGAKVFGLSHTSAFSFEGGRKYAVNLWLKPVNGGTPSLSGLKIRVTLPNASYKDYPFVYKTSGIEGWYMAEAEVNFKGMNQLPYAAKEAVASLIMPSGFYYDDVRFVPIDASMKSFVYDPVSFKLIAQLDENNFASFYEYDQEGQLVRTKKETEKGIMTITESRRANYKSQ